MFRHTQLYDCIISLNNLNGIKVDKNNLYKYYINSN